MRASAVDLRQNVEKERVDVVIERLVIEKELSEETEVLAVDLIVFAIDFKN